MRIMRIVFNHIDMPSRRRRFRTKPKPQPKRPPANEEIKAPQVRLVTADGGQAGVVDTKEAVKQAQESGYDLVVVAGKADPPVARMIDLGKHMYEKRKQTAKQRAKSKSGGIKGVRIGFKTDEHDWNVRLKQAARFIEEGNKVKLEMRLRGREKQRGEQAQKKMEEFVAAIEVPARVEGNFSRSPNNLSVVLTKA